MTRTLRVKIRCPHCRAKIDITAIEPDSFVDCPVCYEPFLTPLEEDYEELSVYPYSDQSFQRDKTHHFSTRRNIVTKGTLRKMQRPVKKTRFWVFGVILGLILLVFLFAVSRQSLIKPEVAIANVEVEKKPRTKGVHNFNKTIRSKSFFILRPDDLNFQPVMKEVKQYINQKGGIMRLFEKKRFSILLSMRENLQNSLMEYPFVGKIKLRSGYVEGEIVGFSDKGIFLKKSVTSFVEWKKIDPRAYAEILTHSALKKSTTISFTPSDEGINRLNQTGLSYFHAAVLLDWYGYKKSALAYKQKALQLSPLLASDMREVLP
ncbi:MAG: hypothetical protein MK132_05140 [Lentisphaerales bacterium]|nr:hypothetical protein [Lentisphaerales bacterium]